MYRQSEPNEGADMETKAAQTVVEGEVSNGTKLTNWVAPTPDVQMVSWSAERVQLIKTQVVKRTDVPDGAFAFFIEVCKRADLDPLLKQAYLIERRSKDDRGNWTSVWEPQFSEAGLESRADRFPDYGGIKGAAVYEKDVFEIDEAEGKVTHRYDPTKDRGQLRGAWAKLTRKGRDIPITWLPFSARVQKKADGQLTKFWATDPEGMIRKCARAEQLRLGYPNAFSGMFVEGEVVTADDERDVTPQAQQDQAPATDARSGVEAAKAKVKAAAKQEPPKEPPKNAPPSAAVPEEKPVAQEPPKEPKPKPDPVQNFEPVQTSAQTPPPKPTGAVATFGGPDFKGKPIASIATDGLEALMAIGNAKLNEVAEKKPDPEPRWVPDVRSCVAAISMELTQRKLGAATDPDGDVPF